MKPFCRAAVVGFLFLLPLFNSTADAGGLELNGGNHWVVVASRQDKQEAIAIAGKFGQQVEHVRVVRSVNGWFAVVFGPVAVSDIVEVRNSLGLSADAYLSRGDRFVEVVYEPGRSKTASSEEPPKTAAVERDSSGSGFFVSSDGIFVTNAHVVKGCSRVTVAKGVEAPRTARVMARDGTNDLAILKTEFAPTEVAHFRFGIRLGESVAAFGFPLSGLLATGGNFTLGNVTALAGMGDDSNELQISAPVQPGNSGGPLLDETGSVVGVVVGKLNALKVAAATDDVAQNVNFAIKAPVVQSFLETLGVRAQMAAAGGAVLRPADIADHAKVISGFVECFR